ncbi:uncharacterized protein LOC108487791 [Gossypium arboreum]|uniref:uncharacterized protein LOC108487791 n=1 Tax=Gossypium arboreum TaxID=29729 RepID=UPI000818FB87|nr:uncharacterized protein LOC108487791 [Gossypium arboreum]
MYRDLRELYWWSSLKREVTDFIARCLMCQQVKAKHQLPSGFLQPVKLELPPELDCIHDVFHVSMLRRYCSNPSHVVSVEEIELRLDFTFEEEPVQNLDRDVKVLRRKSIPLVKVLWRNHSTDESTWEPKDSTRQQYPHLF